uniref:(northern house mosquito) hypothetical protein n=1 Tax=Culex pipiens TaxID=7175 RepID=A0A8D8HUX9_CULPI
MLLYQLDLSSPPASSELELELGPCRLFFVAAAPLLELSELDEERRCEMGSLRTGTICFFTSVSTGWFFVSVATSRIFSPEDKFYRASIFGRNEQLRSLFSPRGDPSWHVSDTLMSSFSGGLNGSKRLWPPLDVLLESCRSSCRSPATSESPRVGLESCRWSATSTWSQHVQSPASSRFGRS